MTPIDEIEELRAELRHSHLTATERRDAEARLNELLESRDGPSSETIDRHLKLVQYAAARPRR